jgi:nucleotide-binding universal stress UspA family protein
MKKISTAFDGLKFSESSLSYAIALAKASKATLSGVFLESFLYHSYNLEGIVSQQGMLNAQIKKRMKQDKGERDRSAKLFEKACKTAKVKYRIHRDLGITIMEAIRESIYSDLLLVNSGDTFSALEKSKPSLFIRELLSEAECPLMIVPTKYHKIEKAVLLYDGRPRAVTAIKMFHHLFTWMKELPIEVLCVSGQDDPNQLPNKELMDEFIRCHYPKATTVQLNGEPEKMIIEHLKDASPGTLIVMGTNQRSRVSRWFRPSLAEKVVEHTELPVFIVNK